MPHFSLIIIGAGPIGLSCGIAAQKAGIDYKIIDKGCLVNSLYHFPENMTFFSSSEKLEIGGLPFTSLALRPSKQEALEYYRRVTEHYALNIGLFESFQSIQNIEDLPEKGRFRLESSRENYTCDYVVNATGFFDFPILMNVPGESLPKVKHYFTSAHHLFRQKVAVIGGSNSATDVALEAYRKGADVTMLVRKSTIGKNVKYWIRPDLESRIREGSIKALFETKILGIEEDHVLFEHKGESLRIQNDFVYAMTGYQPNFKLAEQLGVATSPSTGLPEYDTNTMETNTPGVFLAGVVCGGMNTKEWFIENSRDHGSKITEYIMESHGKITGPD